MLPRAGGVSVELFHDSPVPSRQRSERGLRGAGLFRISAQVWCGPVRLAAQWKYPYTWCPVGQNVECEIGLYRAPCSGIDVVKFAKIDGDLGAPL